MQLYCKDKDFLTHDIILLLCNASIKVVLMAYKSGYPEKSSRYTAILEDAVEVR